MYVFALPGQDAAGPRPRQGRAGRGQLAGPNIPRNPAGRQGVFAAQHGWAIGDADVGHVRQHQTLTAFRHKRQTPQLLQGIADFPGVAHIDREALQALDRLANVLAPHR